MVLLKSMNKAPGGKEIPEEPFQTGIIILAFISEIKLVSF